MNFWILPSNHMATRVSCTPVVRYLYKQWLAQDSNREGCLSLYHKICLTGRISFLCDADGSEGDVSRRCRPTQSEQSSVRKRRGSICDHWRQPRRRCRGHIPQYFGWGTSTGISPPPNYYVLSDIADQYWLPSVRSASSRFYSAIIKTPPIRFSQAGGQSAHEARPPTLNSRWRHWCGPRKSCSVFLQNKFVFSLVPRLPTTLPAFTAERRAAAPLLLSANVWCWLISPVCGALSNKPTARGCCCRSTGQRDARVVGLYKTRLRAVSIII